MDFFEFNKIAGAVLAALLVIFGSRTLVDEVTHKAALETPGFQVEVPEGGHSAGQTEPEAPQVEPIGVRLATADVDKGQSVFRKCAACHLIEEGGDNRVGPNLYDIVGKDIATSDGFSYSPAMSEFAGDWSYEALDQFLENPKGYMPGTKMAFAGIRKPADRAAVIAYLRANTTNPPEIVVPEAPEPETADTGSEPETADAGTEPETAPETVPETAEAGDSGATGGEPATANEESGGEPDPAGEQDGASTTDQ